MISPSISAAAAEAHINDLLADADVARQARLARQANAGGRANRPTKHRPNAVLVAAHATSAAARSLVGTSRIARTAIVPSPGEADA